MMKEINLKDKGFLLWLEKNEVIYDAKDKKLMKALFSEYYIEQETKQPSLQDKLKERLNK